MKPTRRIERYLWSDLAMECTDDMHWQYFKCHVSIPSSSSAVPERWKAKLEGTFAVKKEMYTLKFDGTWAANDTLAIAVDGSAWQTFTAKTSPTVASNSYDISANGSSTVIAEDVMNAIGANSQPTGWTITRDGDTLTFTQNSAASGKSIAITKTSTAGTATLVNTQNYSADTISLCGSTYTCTDATTPSSSQFSPGDAEDVVARIATINPTLTGFTATYDVDTIYLTESTAGTGTDPVVTTTAGLATITVSDDRAYVPANTNLTGVQLIPGDLLEIDTSKGVNGYDTNGNLYVKPINMANYNYSTTKIAGFCTNFYTLDSGETEDIPTVLRDCQLVKDRMPTQDIYGNTISYELTSATCLAYALTEKNFRFGTKDQTGLY